MDTSVPARHWDTDGVFGLLPFPRNTDDTIAPWNGSALVYWDAGNLPPPNANVPPAKQGNDPHEIPRRDPRAADQKETFYLTGEIVDVRNGGSYLACPPGYEDQIPEVPNQFTFDWCP